MLTSFNDQGDLRRSNNLQFTYEGVTTHVCAGSSRSERPQRNHLVTRGVPAHPAPPGKRHRWTIAVVPATAMDHRCCLTRPVSAVWPPIAITDPAHPTSPAARNPTRPRATTTEQAPRQHSASRHAATPIIPITPIVLVQRARIAIRMMSALPNSTVVTGGHEPLVDGIDAAGLGDGSYDGGVLVEVYRTHGARR